MTVQDEAEAAEGLDVGQCSDCGEKAVPVPAFCPCCLGANIARVRHSGIGVVYAATAVRRGPKGVDLPYGLAYVDFDASLRVMARYACGEAPLPPLTRVVVRQSGADADKPLLTATALSEEGAGA